MPEPQEPFRTVPANDPQFAGSTPAQSGLKLFGNVISGALKRANDFVDPVLDFEFSKKKLELLDNEQVKDSTAASKAVPITQPTGIVPGTVNLPRTALIIGGVLVVGIVGFALSRGK